MLKQYHVECYETKLMSPFASHFYAAYIL